MVGIAVVIVVFKVVGANTRCCVGRRMLQPGRCQLSTVDMHPIPVIAVLPSILHFTSLHMTLKFLRLLI